MKKILLTAGMALMLAMTALTPALAVEYKIDAPDAGLFASPTSVEQATVVGGGVTGQQYRPE